MNFSTILVALIVTGIVAFFTGIWAFQNWGIYRFKPETITFEELGVPALRKVTFAAEDGTTLQAFLVPPTQDKPTIISFYGNFTAADRSLRRYAPLVEYGYGFAQLKYRGSDMAEGTSSEAAFKDDARLFYDQLDILMGQAIPPQDRILHGYSLGSGIAVSVAAERDGALLVLEASYASLTDFFTRRLRGLPIGWVMWRERYDSIDQIAQIDMPLFMAHGAKDGALPIETAQRLFEAAVDPKTFKTYPNGGHADLPEIGFIEDMVAAIEGR